MRTQSTALTCMLMLMISGNARGQLQKGNNQFSVGAAATFAGTYRLEAAYERMLKPKLGLEFTFSSDSYFIDPNRPSEQFVPSKYGYSETSNSYTYTLFRISFSADNGHTGADFNQKNISFTPGIKWYSREQLLGRKKKISLQVSGGMQAGVFTGTRDVWVMEYSGSDAPIGFLTWRYTENRKVNYYEQGITGGRLNALMGMRINLSRNTFIELRKNWGLKAIFYVDESKSAHPTLKYGHLNAITVEPGYALKLGVRF
jgi:hypothetical protein